jgi:dihydroneopterin aldolase
VTTTIELAGLELFGYHGVEPEEREQGQPFLFDIWLDVSDAGRSDRLEDTVDYRLVVECVRDVSEARAYQLLEALAAAVADALLASFDVARVRVRVRKPTVRPAGFRVEHSAVTVERERAS